MDIRVVSLSQAPCSDNPLEGYLDYNSEARLLTRPG